MGNTKTRLSWKRQLSRPPPRMASLKERYQAAMVLSGTGDALGYKNGSWEFCHSGEAIYKELTSLGGLSAIKVKLPKWMVSDDTVMLLATGEALCASSGGGDRETLFRKLAEKYKECMRDMGGRAPGGCCTMAAYQLNPSRKDGYHIPFNPRGGGCGAAMRSMCIGLRYPRPSDLKDLVEVSVEAGRMTHHHPTGYLGSLASALLTSFALQGKPLREWGRCLLDTLPLALTYVEETGRAVAENKKEWSYFTKAWTDYLKLRNILDGKSDPVFPEAFGFPERDKFYKSVSFSGWGGSSGHDAPMIALILTAPLDCWYLDFHGKSQDVAVKEETESAEWEYDALLGANWDWNELCNRAMFHAGDSDSTGIIAACCYGAVKGFEGVPRGNWESVEYRDRLAKVAKTLLKLAYPGDCDDDSGSAAVSAQSTADIKEPNSAIETSPHCTTDGFCQPLSPAEGASAVLNASGVEAEHSLTPSDTDVESNALICDVDVE